MENVLQAFSSRGNILTNNLKLMLSFQTYAKVEKGKEEKKKELLLFYMSITQFYLWGNFHSFWRGCYSKLFIITWLLLTYSSGKYKSEHYLRQFNRMVSRVLANKIRRSIRIDLWGLIGLLILNHYLQGGISKARIWE